MEPKRLSKVLAASGIASRRGAEEMIFKGCVEVNGKIILVPQEMVDPAVDKILVDGMPLRKPSKKCYYLLNKPKGTICTSADLGKQKTVIDLFGKSRERLFTVGRLDKDTTGLLIVTNDGQFANEILHPSSNILKEYFVQTREKISQEHIELLKKGIWFEKRKIRPFLVKQTGSNTFKIVVREGKKHEIRIMTRKAKLHLQKLSRTRIGNLPLKGIAIGTWRVMTKKDKQLIFDKPSYQNK